MREWWRHHAGDWLIVIGTVTMAALTVVACAALLYGFRQQGQTRTLAQTAVTVLHQHSQTFAQQKAAEKRQADYNQAVLAYAQTIAGQLKAICAVTHANCPVIPPIP